MKSYTTLSHEGQIDRLRPLAHEALRQFGVKPRWMRIVNHGFNSTFRVLSNEGETYALRLNLGSFRAPGQVPPESVWVQALCDTGCVRVGRPVATASGSLAAEVEGPMGRRVDAVMYRWMPGKMARHLPSADVTRQIGEATAALHEHARAWAVPKGVEFKTFDDVLYSYDWVVDVPSFYHELRERGNEVLAKARAVESIPIHFDLHLNNVLVHRGKVSLIDFDDAVVTSPIMDAAITLYMVRARDEDGSLEAAYWAGLGRSWEDWGLTREEFELLVVGRALLMVNEISKMTSAKVRDYAVTFRERSRVWLDGYVASGRFDPRIG